VLHNENAEEVVVYMVK